MFIFVSLHRLMDYTKNNCCILNVNHRFSLFSAEASPAECCLHAKVLESTQFVDGYKILGFQESIYGEFLGRLRENPRLVASCLVAGERLNQEHTQGVIHTVFTSLYGNCIMQEDEIYLLQVHKENTQTPI